MPGNFAAHIECAFLNSYQARVQYAVDAAGFGFAQGKTLAFRRADLENGGFESLGKECAEDAATTKMMRKKGKRIRLAGPFAQLIGSRSWTQLWERQVRWARLRRATFPWLYAPEVFAGPLPPMLALMPALAAADVSLFPAAGVFLALWYLPEIFLIHYAKWPMSLAALITRDLMLPAVYVAGWIGKDFEWHGRKMRAEKHSPLSPAI